LHRVEHHPENATEWGRAKDGKMAEERRNEFGWKSLNEVVKLSGRRPEN